MNAKRKDLIRRLRKASRQGFAGAGGYGKDSVQFLLKEAADELSKPTQERSRSHRAQNWDGTEMTLGDWARDFYSRR